MGCECNTNEVKNNAYRLLMGKPEGKKQLKRPRYRWVDKLERGEIGWGGMDWIGLFHGRDQLMALVSEVMNLRVPQNSCTTGGLSRRAQPRAHSV
jgi:hypothetical protein